MHQLEISMGVSCYVFPIYLCFQMLLCQWIPRPRCCFWHGFRVLLFFSHTVNWRFVSYRKRLLQFVQSDLNWPKEFTICMTQQVQYYFLCNSSDTMQYSDVIRGCWSVKLSIRIVIVTSRHDTWIITKSLAKIPEKKFVSGYLSGEIVSLDKSAVMFHFKWQGGLNIALRLH